jgi:hypothetical protein
VRHTSTDKLVGGLLLQVYFGIKSPALFSARRIQGNDIIKGCAKNEHIINQYWCRLGDAAPNHRRLRFQVACAELPGQLQVGDVVRSDMRSRAEPVSTRIIAIVRPAASGQLHAAVMQSRLTDDVQ